MYRILCLGGGGLRGIFQSELLAQLQLSFGEFWNSFDLIVGTSTGSLVAACLYQGQDPQRISEHYQRIGPVVFPQNLSWNLTQSTDALRAAVNRKTSGAVYKHTIERLRRMMGNIYGAETRLGDHASRPELAVTATDLAQGKVRVFSPLTSQYDADMRLIDVLLASCAAPGLLPCCAMNDYITDVEGAVRSEKRYFVDGGIWANTPILTAIMLAHSARGIAFNEMRILSIGTGQKYSGFDVQDYSSSRLENSAFRMKLLKMAISAAGDAGDLAARQLVGEQNYLHIAPPSVAGQPIGLFDHRRANSILPDLAVQAASDPAISEFFVRTGLTEFVF